MENILEKYDTELILREAIMRIREFSHIDDNGEIIITYKQLINDIQTMMEEVGIPI